MLAKKRKPKRWIFVSSKPRKGEEKSENPSENPIERRRRDFFRLFLLVFSLSAQLSFFGDVTKNAHLMPQKDDIYARKGIKIEKTGNNAVSLGEARAKSGEEGKASSASGALGGEKPLFLARSGKKTTILTKRASEGGHIAHGSTKGYI